MVNFLALLGWSPGGDFEEVMTMEQLITAFSEKGLLRKAAVFDPKKLEWMNGQHLSRIPLADLEPRVTPAIVAAGLATARELEGRREWYHALLDLLRVRARLVDDIVRQAEPYFRDAIAYDPEAVAKHWTEPAITAALLSVTADALGALADWQPAPMEESLRALAERQGVGGGKIFQPLRVALTGLTVSPGIFEVMVSVLSLALLEQRIKVLPRLRERQMPLLQLRPFSCMLLLLRGAGDDLAILLLLTGVLGS
jgi:glutamyl-tRNA synthetase